MQSTFKLIGERELLAKLQQLDRAAQGSALENAATAGILPIQNEAIRLAPYESGNLSRSIHTETVEKSSHYVETATGTDVEYAARQEFGFSDTDSLGREYNQPAHPYMRPAYDTKHKEAENETKNALIDLILAAAQ